MTKTIVITGAGRGIGRATAQACAAQGQRVVLISRTAAEIEALAAEIDGAGGQALAIAADVADEPAMERALAQAAEYGGGAIDALVCAAGSALVAPFTVISLADWERTLRSNLTGTFVACKHAAPLLREGGSIIALSSIAGRSGFPEWSAYSAAKFGLMGFTQAIREELRPRGIRVTTIVSAAVDTPLWEDVPGDWNRSRMLQASEVAATILFALGQPAHVQIDELQVGHMAGKL